MAYFFLDISKYTFDTIYNEEEENQNSNSPKADRTKT